LSLKGDGATYEVKDRYSTVGSTLNMNCFVAGGDDARFTLHIVYAHQIAEKGVKERVAGDNNRAGIIGNAVAPTQEFGTGESHRGNDNLFAIGVLTGSIKGTDGRIVGEEGNLICFGCKDGGIFEVGEDLNRSGIQSGAIGPI
jgi:hypothetical protein